MADSINFHNATVEDILSLDNIRATLQRMEESIVFRLIERAQFGHNSCVYRDRAFPELVEKENWTGSWLAWSIKETEKWHAKLGRWLAPDEHAFTPIEQLPRPVLKPNDYPDILHPQHVNVTEEILAFYTQDIVPKITQQKGKPEDDRQYGSSVVCDIEALGAIARRIHFGMFVSESKFRSDPAAFVPHIRSRNIDALSGLITKPAVEEVLLARVRQKADVYGQNLDQTCTHHPGPERRKIQSEDIVLLYQKFIIPLTKKVEIDYLLERYVRVCVCVGRKAGAATTRGWSDESMK